MPQTSWTDAEDAILIKLWKEGVDAHTITCDPALKAKGRTRNSVISRAHRLNLPPHSSRQMRIKPSTISATSVRAKPARVKSTRPEPQTKKAAPPPPQPIVEILPELEMEGSSGLGAIGAIQSLRQGQCRFPVGDPRSETFSFCKNKQAPGMSYCPACAKKAYQPPSLQRRTDDRIRQDLVTKEKLNA